MRETWIFNVYALAILQTATSTFASLNTIGSFGINSAGLTRFDGMPLNGDGIVVGQVEELRPALPGYDSPANSNSTVVPAGIYIQAGGNTTPNMNLGSNHATWVAGVIISTDATDSTIPPDNDAPLGVAPMADLHASAYVTLGSSVAAYQNNILSAQYIANTVGAPIINYSASKPKAAPTDLTDGNSLLTLGYDWISYKYDVLNVVLGYQGVPVPSGLPLPTDHFNGMTIGRSSKVANTYQQVSAQNNYSEDATGARTSISLIAPGDNIEFADVGDTESIGGGTSFAAPHVTGTAALLRQYADERIMNAGGPLWKPDPNANARRHEVMKAVLMNSADKLEDTGDGMRLGMTRTVLKQDGVSDWLDTDAYAQQSIPLDLEMGAGHLNARRALQQFASGEIDATVPTGTTVPQIGWDYANTLDTGEVWNEYVFTDPLPAGSFVSITLAWDRIVNLDMDGGTMGEYDAGDTFESVGFNDLDLYLLPQGASDIGEAISSSTSTDSNLEHLFFQIQTTGMYEFWAYEFDSPVELGTDYAVAWWAFNGPTAPGMTGDYNGDTVVDSEDYDLWRASFGSTTELDADGNGDNVISAADYVVWRDNLGATLGSGSAAVPEPGAVGLMLAVVGVVGTLSRKRRG